MAPARSWPPGESGVLAARSFRTESAKFCSTSSRLSAAGHRAIMGKSSGGFGAMITPMLRPDLFGALATHAGDSLYELCYVPEFGKDVRQLRDYGGDIWRWWIDYRYPLSLAWLCQRIAP